MAGHVELEEFIDYARVEEAYKLVTQAQEQGDTYLPTIGWRAAKARDPKLLKALEIASNLMHQEEDNQRRESRRTTDVFSHTLLTTETQFFTSAYETVDRNTPIENLVWFYGAGAWLAGLVDRKRFR